MKYALIENGVVTNLIIGGAPGYVPVTDSVSIGDLVDGSNFIKPGPPAAVEYGLGLMNFQASVRRKLIQSLKDGNQTDAITSLLK